MPSLQSTPFCLYQQRRLSVIRQCKCQPPCENKAMISSVGPSPSAREHQVGHDNRPRRRQQQCCEHRTTPRADPVLRTLPPVDQRAGAEDDGAAVQGTSPEDGQPDVVAAIDVAEDVGGGVGHHKGGEVVSHTAGARGVVVRFVGVWLVEVMVVFVVGVLSEESRRKKERLTSNYGNIEISPASKRANESNNKQKKKCKNSYNKNAIKKRRPRLDKAQPDDSARVFSSQARRSVLAGGSWFSHWICRSGPWRRRL